MIRARIRAQSGNLTVYLAHSTCVIVIGPALLSDPFGDFSKGARNGGAYKLRCMGSVYAAMPDIRLQPSQNTCPETPMAPCKRHCASELTFAFSPVKTIRPIQISRSRLFIPEIIDSATSVG